MWPILQSLVENCSLAIEYTDKGLQFVANGPVGVAALVFVCSLLAFHLRRRRRTPRFREKRRKFRDRFRRARSEKPFLRNRNADANKVPSASRPESPYLGRGQYVAA